MKTTSFKKTLIASAFTLFSTVSLANIIDHPIYVSSTGNNQNDGLTPETAWKSLNFLNGKEFGPGAKILFKRGQTFPGSLTLQGSGSAEQPIIISAYGAGNKPILNGWWDKSEIFLLNSGNSYIDFIGLKLSNYNINNKEIKERYAINIKPPEGSGEVNHLHFQKLDFFNIQGSGKAIHEDNHRSNGINLLTVDNDIEATKFNDVLIETSTFTDIDGLGVLLKDLSQDIADVRKYDTEYFPTTNFIFQNNSGLNIYRNLLMIRGTKDALIQRNSMDTTVEGSAFWPFATEGTVVQYNIFKRLRAEDADAYALHFDYNNKNTLMQYNIGYDIEGGLIEYIVNSKYPIAFQENGIARYNIGIDVGYRNKINGAGIFLTGGVTGGHFYNNTLIQLNKPMTNAISFSNWGNAWPTNNSIYNNIFYAAGSEPVGYNQPSRFNKLGNVVSNNLYAGNISAPQTWDNIVTDINPITGDPKFVNPEGLTAEDFMINEGSAAIGQGLFIENNGGLDYFGNEVAEIEVPAIGAHQLTITTLAPTDDATVKNHYLINGKKHKEGLFEKKSPNKNIGSKSTIGLKSVDVRVGEPKNPEKNKNEKKLSEISHSHDGFMKFTVDSHRAIKSAKLSLFVNKANYTITIREVEDNTWTESTIIDKNAPIIGSIISQATSVADEQYVEFDLSTYITQAGKYSIALTNEDSGKVRVNSKEAELNKPLLEILY